MPFYPSIHDDDPEVFTCRICGYVHHVDDLVTPTPKNRLKAEICLDCFERYAPESIQGPKQKKHLYLEQRLEALAEQRDTGGPHSRSEYTRLTREIRATQNLLYALGA